MLLGKRQSDNEVQFIFCPMFTICITQGQLSNWGSVSVCVFVWGEGRGEEEGEWHLDGHWNFGRGKKIGTYFLSLLEIYLLWTENTILCRLLLRGVTHRKLPAGIAHHPENTIVCGLVLNGVRHRTSYMTQNTFCNLTWVSPKRTQKWDSSHHTENKI